MRPLEQRYAQALFELTQEEAQFRSDTEFLTGDSSLWKVLCSPCVSTAEKHALLERLLRDKTTPLLLNFYRLLCDRERIFLLPRILTYYHALCLDAEQAAEATLRCARPLAEADREQLSQALCRLHGKNRVELLTRLDPSLIGGFVIQLGDMTYDKSVRGMLRGLQRSLKER